MAKALPLIAYPDLESRVKALENDGYVYLPKVINGEELFSNEKFFKLEKI